MIHRYKLLERKLPVNQRFLREKGREKERERGSEGGGERGSNVKSEMQVCNKDQFG